MKRKVTITLPDDLAARVRTEAARHGKSMSCFIGDLLAERCTSDDAAAALEKFLSDVGVAGISKNWRGRVDLYADREDELRRRRKASRQLCR